MGFILIYISFEIKWYLSPRSLFCFKYKLPNEKLSNYGSEWEYCKTIVNLVACNYGKHLC